VVLFKNAIGLGAAFEQQVYHCELVIDGCHIQCCPADTVRSVNVETVSYVSFYCCQITPACRL
jgi:hypothetical protein